jgi:hypothetical protein
MPTISGNIDINGKPMSDMCSAGIFYVDVVKKININKFLFII